MSSTSLCKAAQKVTTGEKGKLFIFFVPSFTLSLLSKIVCSLCSNCKHVPADDVDDVTIASYANDFLTWEVTGKIVTGSVEKKKLNKNINKFKKRVVTPTIHVISGMEVGSLFNT